MIGRTISGRYTIRATIGSGGMGFVYRATQSPIEREVALKVLRVDLAHQDGIAERFTREARAASRIQHPNAITIYEFGEDDGIFYLAMELLYGETLRQRIRREPPLESEQSLSIFEAMGGALGAAHRVGVVHRDLKPDNIFLAQFDGVGEVVKVLDFGLAKLLDRGADAEGLVTDVNLRLGTPRYMAPEQALGLQPIDARCDVYALGLLLFEMLAHRAPYVGEDGMEVLAQRLRREAPRLSHIRPDGNFSEALEDLVASMLLRDREHRPADANEVVTRLRELRRNNQVYRPSLATDQSPILSLEQTVNSQRRLSGSNLGPSPVAPNLSGPLYRSGPHGPVQRAATIGDDASLAMDDFDKPTVVLSAGAREDIVAHSTAFAAALNGQSPGGPLAVSGPMAMTMERSIQPSPQPLLSPGAQAHYGPPMTYASQAGNSVPDALISGPATTVHPAFFHRFQLSRRIIVVVLVVAVGAPLLALLIRWSESRKYPSEPMTRTTVLPREAPATEPAQAAKVDRPPSTRPPTMETQPVAPVVGEIKPKPADPPKPDRPKVCYIRIVSTPPGGKVERDGQIIGVTPMLDSMPYSGSSYHYRVTTAGFQPFDTSVTAEHRRTINALLKPAPVPIKAPARPTPVPPPTRPTPTVPTPTRPPTARPPNR